VGGLQPRVKRPEAKPPRRNPCAQKTPLSPQRGEGFLCPSGAGRDRPTFHGFRFAPPVAIGRDPFGVSGAGHPATQLSSLFSASPTLRGLRVHSSAFTPRDAAEDAGT